MLTDQRSNNGINSISRNREEQYSISPVDQLKPPGSTDAARVGLKHEWLFRNRDRDNTAGFAIGPVTDPSTAARAAYVREEVFGREWKFQVPLLPAQDGIDMLTLIAWREPQSEPAAVVTVVETTGDHALHQYLGLTFRKNARVARYMQLAVLKPYRGLGLPLQLVLEARRQFVEARLIDYTWLLFDADRARTSSFCRLLGFRASSETYHTEYGHSRVLVCNDRTGMAETSDSRAQQRLAARRAASRTRATGPRLFAVGNIRADEWVAQ